MKVNEWTDAEFALIRKHYPAGGVRGCVPHLPGRTEAAISMRASMIGVHKSDRYSRRVSAERPTPTRPLARPLGAPRPPAAFRPAASQPDAAAAPAPPKPKQIVAAADLRPGMVVNRYPVGTCAAPAPREITQAKFSTAGSRTFFQIAWMPVSPKSGKQEVPMAQWDFARHPDLAFELMEDGDVQRPTSGQERQ